MTRQEIYDRLLAQFGESVVAFSNEPFTQFIVIDTPAWYHIAQYLKTDPDLYFDSLMCVTGMDLGPKKESMEVVYDLFSMRHRHKITIKVVGPREDFHVPSVESIWRVADWHEREVYDMFGILFDGHRHLKRLLLPEDWEGYPLRKDYQVQEYYHGIRVPKIKPKKLAP